MTTTSNPPQAAMSGAAAEDTRSVPAAAISAEYVLRIRPCADGFAASLRKCVVGRNPELRVSVGPVAIGVAPTAAEAMIAAIANAQIPDPPSGPPPGPRGRSQNGRLIL